MMLKNLETVNGDTFTSFGIRWFMGYGYAGSEKALSSNLRKDADIS